MMEFNKKNEFVYEIHYDITLACNNRCDYCYQLPYLDNTLLVNKDIFENTINSINQFKEQHPEYSLEILIKGGEPLLLVNEVTEFIERVYQAGVTNIHIFTNFNFKPNGSKIDKIISLHSRIPFNLKVSVHESSNIDWIKENIKTLKSKSSEYYQIDIISQDSVIDFVVDFAEWMINEFGPYTYTLGEITLDNVGLLDYTNPKLKNVLANERQAVDEVCIDDKIYSTREAADLDFKNISSQYYTTCKINACSIRYDGTLKTMCQHPWTSHITKGIEIQRVFCNNYTCTCNLHSYKQLLRPKNAKV